MTAGAADHRQNSLASAQAWLMCRAGAHVCGLPLRNVIETMRPLPVERLQRAPKFVEGLSVIRGTPTPVVHMRLLMGEAPAPSARVVTVRTGDHAVALAFDAVLGVQTMEETQTTALPPLVKNVADDVVTAVTTRDSALILFLETARILPPAVLADLTGPTPPAAGTDAP